jgi:hypothetical protein
MFCRRVNSGGNSGHRVMTVVLLVAVGASFVPLSIDVVSSRDKCQSQPYPCQNRPCGCASAEQCWRQCCCFTNVEKIAWARKQSVTLPAYVVQAATAELETSVVEAEAEDDNGSPNHEAAEQLECCKSSGSEQQQNRETERPAEERSGQFVNVLDVLKCGGHGFFWNSLPPGLIPDGDIPKLRIEPDRWDRPQSVLPNLIAGDPPEPPPRLS